MRSRPVATPKAGERAWVIAGGLLLALLVVLAGGLVALVTVGRGWLPAPSSAAVSYAYPEVRPAPALDLVDQDGQPFSLASLGGQRTLVFFGYTHCPDVCPATVGIVGQVLAGAGPGTRAVFVTVDPERDTPSALKDYLTYISKGFTALTGTAARIRSTADAWGVRYARVETGSANGYGMSHTADVYLVDANGLLRAHFPFGTGPEPMLAMLGRLPAGATASPTTPVPSGAGASPSASLSAAPTPTANVAPSSAGGLEPVVVSTSVWSGGKSPVILSLFRDGVRLDDPAASATAQLIGADGSPVGSPVPAIAVQPPGESRVLYVPTLDIPGPGAWRVDLTVTSSGTTSSGSLSVSALDPGATPQLGGRAPNHRTPTLADVNGVALAVTTDPAPDLRLSEQSTTDALAAHAPFVLVLDSSRFRVTSACGKAIGMARYLADRWRDVAFIHLEPYRYSVITDTAILDGSLSDPPVKPVAAAWGLGSGPWGARAMPWAFVVDGHGIVVAKYQGVIGSDDIDVILSLIAARG